MLSINASALRIIRVGEIEEIPVCDGYTCSRIDKTDKGAKHRKRSRDGADKIRSDVRAEANRSN
jgi:hypothetical protein